MRQNRVQSNRTATATTPAYRRLVDLAVYYYLQMVQRDARDVSSTDERRRAVVAAKKVTTNVARRRVHSFLMAYPAWARDFMDAPGQDEYVREVARRAMWHAVDRGRSPAHTNVFERETRESEVERYGTPFIQKFKEVHSSALNPSDVARVVHGRERMRKQRSLFPNMPQAQEQSARVVRNRARRGMIDEPNRAVDGRLTPEERAAIPSKIERRLETPEALRGFSIKPANDAEGVPGTIWVHREPDGSTIVQKLGDSQFVRVDPLSHGGYEARVWYRGLRGEEPRMGRMNAHRVTLDAAVTWARDLLTREEREAEVRQRMEAGVEEGSDLSVGAVVRFRDRGARRRYVVARVMRYPTWVDYLLVALSGGEAGSAPSGIRREQVVLDDDQTVQFEGANARKLERKFDTYRRM